MSDTPPRSGWILPVLLAISSTVAIVLAILYIVRPNAGELGAVRIIVADESGNVSNTIRVTVGDAPYPQKGTVSPGHDYRGTVNYEAPYLTKPNLTLTSNKRRYRVLSETEFGFTWLADPLPDDFNEDAKKAGNVVEKWLDSTLETAYIQGKLKRGLVFEDFSWEAKGLRAPASALPPKTYKQDGKFYSIIGQEAVVAFKVPFASPPNVELTGARNHVVVISECTAKGFKWRNVAKDNPNSSEGEVYWTATGVLGPSESK
jgi:hypothetical protein